MVATCTMTGRQVMTCPSACRMPPTSDARAEAGQHCMDYSMRVVPLNSCVL